MRRDLNLKTKIDLGRARDRTGRDIDLIVYRDVEKANRGWQIDVYAGIADGGLAGFLRTSNIPAEAFEKWYPTPLHYAHLIAGTRVFKSDVAGAYEAPLRDPYTEFSDQEFAEMVDSVAALYDWRLKIQITERHKKDREFFRRELEKHSRPYRELSERFAEFRLFHSTDPFVEFVCTEQNPSHGIKEDQTGRGVATLLYLAAAHDLLEKGKALRSSSLQHERATACWERFTQAGWAVPDTATDRLLLRGELCPKPAEMLTLWDTMNPGPGRHGH